MSIHGTNERGGLALDLGFSDPNRSVIRARTALPRVLLESVAILIPPGSSLR